MSVMVRCRFPLPDFFYFVCELNKKYWYHKESNEVSGESAI